jgi:hypothetical protein
MQQAPTRIHQQAAQDRHVFADPGPVPGTNTRWGPEIRIGIPQPALNVYFDSDSNVTSLNFSYDGLARSTYITTIQEQMTKLPIPIPIPDIDPLKPPLAIKPAPALRVDLTDDTAKLNPIEALGRSVARASASADAVTAQGQLDVARYGHVLKARSLVGVRGAGTAYAALLRQERHAQHQARRVHPVVHPGPQRPDFDHPEGVP